jgi:hypothetical protein
MQRHRDAEKFLHQLPGFAFPEKEPIVRANLSRTVVPVMRYLNAYPSPWCRAPSVESTAERLTQILLAAASYPVVAPNQAGTTAKEMKHDIETFWRNVVGVVRTIDCGTNVERGDHDRGVMTLGKNTMATCVRVVIRRLADARVNDETAPGPGQTKMGPKWIDGLLQALKCFDKAVDLGMMPLRLDAESLALSAPLSAPLSADSELAELEHRIASLPVHEQNALRRLFGRKDRRERVEARRALVLQRELDLEFLQYSAVEGEMDRRLAQKDARIDDLEKELWEKDATIDLLEWERKQCSQCSERD